QTQIAGLPIASTCESQDILPDPDPCEAMNEHTDCVTGECVGTPTGARLVLNSGGGGAFTLPATVEMDVGAPVSFFSGSNGGFETGGPIFSSQVEAGATFLPGIGGVVGFPQPLGGCTILNRPGHSSFIAIKSMDGGRRKIWINASVGCFEISGDVEF